MYSFTSIVLPKLTEANRIEMNVDITPTAPIYDVDSNLVIGIRRYADDQLSTGNVCKIYGRLSERPFIDYT
jgi:hypothetical protein